MPNRWGAILVTFPRERGTWTVPDRVWHADFPFDLPPDPLPGAKMFALISDVEPRIGGTLVAAGSHRVVGRFVGGVEPAMRGNTRRTRLALLASHPWLRALTSPEDREDRVGRFMESSATIDGMKVRVVELTGRAGDVVLAHPWLLHCAAPTAARRRGSCARWTCIAAICIPRSRARKEALLPEAKLRRTSEFGRSVALTT